MRKKYLKKKDENLAQWVERVAVACQGRSLKEVHEMISEVSKTSYILGTNAAIKNPLLTIGKRKRTKDR